MTRYAVEFAGAASKEVRKLDPTVRRRVLVAVKKLEDDPRPAGAVKLPGYSDAQRIRVGDYRVLYEVTDSAVLVVVFRVGHRGQVYDSV